MDQERKHPPRPWRVSCAGGQVLATFYYLEHAVERAQDLTGRVRMTLWVHHRDRPDPSRYLRFDRQA